METRATETAAVLALMRAATVTMIVGRAQRRVTIGTLMRAKASDAGATMV